MNHKKDKPDLAVDVLLKIEERVRHLSPMNLAGQALEDLVGAMINQGEIDDEIRKQAHTGTHKMNQVLRAMGEEPLKYTFEWPGDPDIKDPEDD